MSWTKKVGHPSEVLKKGEDVQAVVLSVDQEKQRIALGLKQMQEDPWLHVIPENYKPGMVVRGQVTKIANFGVFVELEDGLEGLLHVSEISDHKVEKPEDELKSGQELEVKILRVDGDERKIGLSLKRAQWGGRAGEARGGPQRAGRPAEPARRGWSSSRLKFRTKSAKVTKNTKGRRVRLGTLLPFVSSFTLRGLRAKPAGRRGRSGWTGRRGRCGRRGVSQDRQGWPARA